MSKSEMPTTANISNNINLNLSQNDLIDMVIQEQLEITENELTKVKEQLQNLKNEKEGFRERFKEKLVSRELVKQKEFNKIVKDYGLTVNSSIGLIEGRAGASIKIGTCISVDRDDAESYKNPIAYAKKYKHYREVWINSFEKANIDFVASNDKGLNVHISTCINLTEKETEILLSNDRVCAEKEIKLTNIKCELDMNYLEYAYGEKKIKGKIVKASLKKTGEGKAILDMLQRATNIKMIG